jgi:Raf kinase inhibitor-like YbhB/YbcL family protein
MAFTLVSNSFKDGDYLANDLILSADLGFGGASRNKSPRLKWSDAPSGTKSFAVTCYGPDALTGSGFWHWLVVNIPADESELPEGAGSASGQLPASALQTRTDFGAPGYGGPRPPPGDHPYRDLFTIFAAKTDRLDVKADTSAAVVGFNLNFNTLARAEIMGLCSSVRGWRFVSE